MGTITLTKEELEKVIAKGCIEPDRIAEVLRGTEIEKDNQVNCDASTMYFNSAYLDGNCDDPRDYIEYRDRWHRVKTPTLSQFIELAKVRKPTISHQSRLDIIPSVMVGQIALPLDPIMTLGKMMDQYRLGVKIRDYFLATHPPRNTRLLASCDDIDWPQYTEILEQCDSSNDFEDDKTIKVCFYPDQMVDLRRPGSYVSPESWFLFARLFFFRLGYSNRLEQLGWGGKQKLPEIHDQGLATIIEEFLESYYQPCLCGRPCV